MRYYEILSGDRYAKLIIHLDLDRYRELACQMTFGRPYKKGQPFPERDILESVEQTLDKNWHWEEDPHRKGPPPHPSIPASPGPAKAMPLIPLPGTASRPSSNPVGAGSTSVRRTKATSSSSSQLLINWKPRSPSAHIFLREMGVGVPSSPRPSGRFISVTR